MVHVTVNKRLVEMNRLCAIRVKSQYLRQNLVRTFKVAVYFANAMCSIVKGSFNLDSGVQGL